MSGDATDLDALAEARLDGELDDAAWSVALVAHGEALASALARARALRGAVAGLERPAMPDALRAAIVAGGAGAGVAAAPTAGEPPPRVAAPPLRFPWRTIVPAALAACLIVALLATLVLPWRGDGEPSVAKREEQRTAAATAPEARSHRLLAVPSDSLGDERDGGGARRGELAGDASEVAKDAKRADQLGGATVAMKKADAAAASADKAASLASADDAQAIAAANKPAIGLDAAGSTARAPGAARVGAGAGWRQPADGPSAPTPASPPVAAPAVDGETLALQESAPATVANAGRTTAPAATDAAGGGLAVRERALEQDRAKDALTRRANVAVAAANDALAAAKGAAVPAPAAAPAAPAAPAASAAKPAAPASAGVATGAAAPALAETGAAAPAGADADDELLASARRFVADKEKSQPDQALRKTAPDEAPGPLAFELAVVDAAAQKNQAATRDAAPVADAKPAAKVEATARVFQLRVVNRTIGVAPLPGGMPTLHGFDAAGHEAWSVTLHPTAQIVSAGSDVRWQEPATGALVPPPSVRTLRVQWGTLHSAAVPWTP